jgi:hypothetical protein
VTLPSAKETGKFDVHGHLFRAGVIAEKPPMIRTDPHVTLVILAQASNEVVRERTLLGGDGLQDTTAFLVGKNDDPTVGAEPGPYP